MVKIKNQTWIDSRLTEQGLMRKDIGAALNLSSTRVSELLDGRRKIQRREILPLAALLGVLPEDLLKNLTKLNR